MTEHGRTQATFAADLTAKIAVGVCTVFVSFILYQAKENFENSLSRTEGTVQMISQDIRNLNESVKNLTVHSQVSRERIVRTEKRLEKLEQRSHDRYEKIESKIDNP